MGYYKLDQDKAFLISQKALVVEANKLLVLKTPPDINNGQSKWELPGGLLELDESLSSGLLREVREETGLLIAVGRTFAVWDYWSQGFEFRDGRVLDVKIIGMAFHCQRIAGDVQISDEHCQFGWMTNAELMELDFSLNSAFAVHKYLAEKLVVTNDRP